MLQQGLARARRSRQPLSLIVVDLDGLKTINDRHGHEVGDRALRAVGQTLRDTLRLTDVARRVGGDEFTLLAPNTSKRRRSRWLNGFALEPSGRPVTRTDFRGPISRRGAVSKGPLELVRVGAGINATFPRWACVDP
jgi:GGDEF domain-containing protein